MYEECQKALARQKVALEVLVNLKPIFTALLESQREKMDFSRLP